MLRVVMTGKRKKGKTEVAAGPLIITAAPYSKSDDWGLLIEVGGAEYRQRIRPTTRDKLQAFLEALEADQETATTR